MFIIEIDKMSKSNIINISFRSANLSVYYMISDKFSVARNY